MALFSKKDDQKTKTPPEVEVNGEQIEPIEAVGSAMPKVDDAHAYGIVISPHTTEKATNGAMHRQYTFKVFPDANKIAIKKAIEKLYKVQVRKVNIRNMPSKTRQVGRHMGTKSGFKKATVILREGYKIETS